MQLHLPVGDCTGALNLDARELLMSEHIVAVFADAELGERCRT